MPDFSVLGVCGLICVVLWLWLQAERKEKEIYRDKLFEVNEQATRATTALAALAELTREVVTEMVGRGRRP